MTQQSRILEMSANIVSSLVRSRPTEPHEVPVLMDVVHDGLKRLQAGERAVTVREAIVEVEGSTRSDHLANSSPTVPASAGTVPESVSTDLDRDTGFVRDGVVTVTDGHIVCLEDGRKVTFLGRHLKSIGVDPADYRARHGLPDDYPMTAPGYVAEKSRLAKRQGLGRNVKPSLAGRANGTRPARIAGRLSPNY